MGKKIGEFFVDITVDAMSGNLSVRQLVSALGDLEASALGGAFGVTKAVDKFVDMAKGAMNAAIGLEMLRALTGESTSTLQRWTKAAEATRIGADVVVSGLRGYQSLVAQMGRTGVPAQELQQFFLTTGVSILDAKGKARDYFDVLEDISKSEKFWALDKTTGGRAQTLDALAKLGGDEKTIRLLELMRSGEWGKALSAAPVMSDKQVKDLAQVSRDFGQISNLMLSITNNLMTWGGKLHETLKSVITLLEDVNKLIPGKTTKEEFMQNHPQVMATLMGGGPQGFLLQKFLEYSKSPEESMRKLTELFGAGVGVSPGMEAKLDITSRVVGPDGKVMPSTATVSARDVKAGVLTGVAQGRGSAESAKGGTPR